ncbi:hypothetical protein AGMMS50229_11840 [Campylobacterota bacterium]|nr:hypothetical protein AGMMS50229_11840 [Campylobacterota bacterium]
MRIAFARVSDQPIAIEAALDGAKLTATLSKRNGFVLLDGALTGSLRLSCVVCDQEYDADLDEPVRLLINDGIYDRKNTDDEPDEPIVEMSGEIDLDEILAGEIAAFLCDYHRCESCQNSEDEREWQV